MVRRLRNLGTRRVKTKTKGCSRTVPDLAEGSATEFLM